MPPKPDGWAISAGARMHSWASRARRSPDFTQTVAMALMMEPFSAACPYRG
jgi:hypothetical protein